MKITVLGSGTSQGVPIIGCKCPTCISSNPNDKRLRVSVFLEVGGLKLLIDTSPDFRQQMLTNNITDVDAILYTHHHIDHIMGLDDIRQINQLHKKSVDIYGNETTIGHIKKTFSYVFDTDTFQGGGIPNIQTHILKYEPFEISGVAIIPIEYDHGPSKVWGYRINDFAYMTDCSNIPENEFEKLAGLKVLILDGLRYRPHPTHFSFAQAIEAAQKINAEKTYFTHITHDILHDEDNAKLPEGIELGYDGLVIEL